MPQNDRSSEYNRLMSDSRAWRERKRKEMLRKEAVLAAVVGAFFVALWLLPYLLD